MNRDERIMTGCSILKEQAQPVKWCVTCGKLKSVECFHKCISEESEDGLHPECIVCVTEREETN